MNLQVNSLKADHPITPPPELVEQWVQATESNDCIGAFPTNFEKRICIAAALRAAVHQLNEKRWEKGVHWARMKLLAIADELEIG
jgi:hypothetical protein